MEKKTDFHFEDLDKSTQDIIIDLLVSIIKNMKKQELEREEKNKGED